jgi:hypothetical protein
MAHPQPIVPDVVAPQAAAQPLESPDGLKRYVHKCMQQCANKDQIQAMQKEIALTIKNSLQSGTVHTTNWDNKPLLSVPAAGTAAAITNYGSYSQGSGANRHAPSSTAAAVQFSGGTAAAIKKYKSPQSNGENHYGPSSTAAAVQSSGGTAAAIKNYKSLQVGSHGPPGSETDYYGPDKRLPSGNHYGPSSGDDNHGGGSKYKWQRKDKYEASDSGSYYSSSGKDLAEDDFVAVPKNPKKKRKKQEKSPGVNVEDGFQRSSSALAKRARRFSGAGGISTAASVPVSPGSSMKRYMGLALIGGSKKLDEADYEHMKVKGTCQTLEKEYLRLTAPPRAECVRPQPVLSKHLENLKAERTDLKTRRDYTWFCSQLKAARQDLTVQRIVNAFAVDVYETHARMALEEGDLNEYNQCQTQLKELYETLHDDKEATKNRNEFIAYRLIYYVFLTGNKKYEGGSSDLFKIMLSLTPGQRQDPCISHALKVRVSVADFDYHAFFRLQDSCPKHGIYLMDLMVPKVRHWALQRIFKAYRPSVSTKHVLVELGFDRDEELELGKKWLVSCGAVLSGDEFLTKDSVVRESDMTEKVSSLI